MKDGTEWTIEEKAYYKKIGDMNKRKAEIELQMKKLRLELLSIEIDKEELRIEGGMP